MDARCNVHAVAEQIIALDDDVAQVDAHAKLHLLFGREMFVARAQRGLDFGCAANGLDCAVEFGEQRVARRIEDPSPVQVDQRFEDFPVAAKHAHCALFVGGHHFAVACDIGAQDRCEPPLERLRTLWRGFIGHGVLPDTRYTR